WKKNNPTKVLDNNSFYTIAEVYNYNISSGKIFDFGDKKVNYYANGFNNMINFEFKWDAKKDYEFIFSKYSNILNGELKGSSVLNYLSSHDDGAPFDGLRTRGIEAGTKLLLSPGVAQVFYGDETNRVLEVDGTQGDAKLRSFMNWNAIKSDPATKANLVHWQKLGKFRKNHPAVGAGIHEQISATPYLFKRTFTKGAFTDKVLIGLDLPVGKKQLNVSTVFPDGTKIKDSYSGLTTVVKNGQIKLKTDYNIVLLEKR
ncbi:MAG: alpha-amylase, partial [Flavobacterium sp.]|nr:alpha-amylase [Flavobacterium sp.]